MNDDRPARAELPGSLFVIGAITILGFVLGANWHDPLIASLAALTFCAFAIATALRINGRRTLSTAERVFVLGDLMAAIYGWGSLTMAFAYLGAGLRWQHGWQYALGMSVIAAGIAAATRTVHALPEGERKSAIRGLAARLAIVHAAAAIGALVWLVLSGKLVTIKDDWAANIVFMAGGCAASAASLLLWRTHATAGDGAAQR